jgi:hypothetical protein
MQTGSRDIGPAGLDKGKVVARLRIALIAALLLLGAGYGLARSGWSALAPAAWAAPAEPSRAQAA